MTYDELVAIYPFVDLFLELFKGLAPTIVAVLAIIINNSIAVKRDKRANDLSKNKKINEGKIAVLNEMLHKHIELAQLKSQMEECINEFIHLQSSYSNERIRKADEFGGYVYQFRWKILEINAYNFAMMQRYDFEIDISKTIDEALEYIVELSSVYERFCELDTIADVKEKQVELSGIKEKIDKLQYCPEMWTTNMIYIGDEIKKLYEQY